MSEWPFVRIRSVVEGKETWNAHKDERSQVDYLEISGIDNSLGRVIRTRKITPLKAPSRAKRSIRKGDIVFGTTRPYLKNIAVIPAYLDKQVCSTGFCVLRPKPHKVIAEWLFSICRSNLVVKQIIPGQEKHAYPAVSDEAVLDSLIPLPNINEQRRIVARIEEMNYRAEEARRARREAIAQISTLFFLRRRAVYQSLLSDFPSKPLGKCGKILGGGTPSKSRGDYWHGDIPWIAPKEMKTFRIAGSSEQITGTAVSESSATLIPAPAVLFVVRGMILARYVPVGVSDVPCTINQDMKAIVPNEDILADYIAHMLLGANDILLNMVETAGHGTKKLETAAWSSLDIPVPSIQTQKAVIEELTGLQEKLAELEALQGETDKALETFQSALLAKAFRGEL